MVIPPILAFRDALRLEKQGVEINPANVLGFYLIGGTIWFFVMCMVSLGVIYFGVCGDSGECYNFRTLAPTLAILVGAYIALPFLSTGIFV